MNQYDSINTLLEPPSPLFVLIINSIDQWCKLLLGVLLLNRIKILSRTVLSNAPLISLTQNCVMYSLNLYQTSLTVLTVLQNQINEQKK